MSKTLETKDKLLNMIKNRKETVTELSSELGLSKATVSQHLQELKKMGLVEEANNQYFKKLKYYQIRSDADVYGPKGGGNSKRNSKIVLGALLTVVAVLACVHYIIPKNTSTLPPTTVSAPTPTSTLTPTSTSTPTPIVTTISNPTGCPASYAKSYDFEPKSSIASFSAFGGLMNFTIPIALREGANGIQSVILGPAQATNFSNMTKLELILSVSNSTAQHGQLLINASLFNTLNQTNNVSGSQNWSIEGITGCRFPNSPGIAIFSGYYTKDNVSYYNSTYGSEFTTSPPLQINGLEPGVYTVLAEDEWGQEAVAHFKVISVNRSTNITTPFTTPMYLGSNHTTAAFGCSFSNSTGTYRVPCGIYDISNAEVFNCASAAASPSGCTQQVLDTKVTVWNPYTGHSDEPSWANCLYSESYVPGSDHYAYCLPINSTAFVIVIGPAPGPL